MPLTYMCPKCDAKAVPHDEPGDCIKHLKTRIDALTDTLAKLERHRHSIRWGTNHTDPPSQDT